MINFVLRPYFDKAVWAYLWLLLLLGLCLRLLLGRLLLGLLLCTAECGKHLHSCCCLLLLLLLLLLLHLLLLLGLHHLQQCCHHLAVRVSSKLLLLLWLLLLRLLLHLVRHVLHVRRGWGHLPAHHTHIFRLRLPILVFRNLERHGHTLLELRHRCVHIGHMEENVFFEAPHLRRR